MKKRFMLTAAGAAATGFAGAANAELVNITHYADRWLGENDWQIYDSNGDMVAACDGGSYSGTFESFSYTNNSATSHWGTVFIGIDLAAGSYNVQMQDTYGDGWAWGSFVGGLMVSGAVESSVYQSLSSAAGPSSSGSATSFNFTVVPAPGALALLGLAGIAGTRRRK
ncbi:MAG: hypothetical protein CMJ38_02075 [Phycisphaerae bacterium]|nr:hypothetical protein [Phycisphaerae bacterium]